MISDNFIFLLEKNIRLKICKYLSPLIITNFSHVRPSTKTVFLVKFMRQHFNSLPDKSMLIFTPCLCLKHKQADIQDEKCLWKVSPHDALLTSLGSFHLIDCHKSDRKTLYRRLCQIFFRYMNRYSMRIMISKRWKF